MLRRILGRIFFSKLRDRPSVGKTAGAVGTGSFLVLAITSWLRARGTDVPPEVVADLVNGAWDFLQGALLSLGVWGIRDAQDAQTDATAGPRLR